MTRHSVNNNTRIDLVIIYSNSNHLISLIPPLSSCQVSNKTHKFWDLHETMHSGTKLHCFSKLNIKLGYIQEPLLVMAPGIFY